MTSESVVEDTYLHIYAPTTLLFFHRYNINSVIKSEIHVRCTRNVVDELISTRWTVNGHKNVLFDFEISKI